MLIASSTKRAHAQWDLVACGRDGDGPFRLEVHYSHGSITEYFQNIASVFHAIEEAERCAEPVIAPDRRLNDIPGDQELTRQFVREEVWASAPRH